MFTNSWPSPTLRCRPSPSPATTRPNKPARSVTSQKSPLMFASFLMFIYVCMVGRSSAIARSEMGVEAAPGLAAEDARLDHAGQQRRRGVQRLAGLGGQGLGDG